MPDKYINLQQVIVRVVFVQSHFDEHRENLLSLSVKRYFIISYNYMCEKDSLLPFCPSMHKIWTDSPQNVIFFYAQRVAINMPSKTRSPTVKYSLTVCENSRCSIRA